MNKLFIPFFTSKSIGEGTSLSLAISHDIITKQPGTIEVERELGKLEHKE